MSLTTPARTLWDRGYGPHLVSVIPPQAALSPNSAVPEDQKGKAPGIRYPGGWGGYNWRHQNISVEELEESGANIGIRGEQFPGLDIDVDDPGLSEVITKLALRFLGYAPERISRGARRLLPYRTDGDPFGRMALKIEWEGRWHLVEWLPAGRQYLIWGVHPSGSLYEWQGDSIWSLEPGDLSPVSRESALGFLRELEERLAAKGIRCEVVGDGRTNEDKAPPQEDLKAPSPEALRALPLPSNPDEFGWDEFIAHGYAFKAAGQDDEALAYERWVEWASQHPKFDPDVCAREWKKLHGPYRAGWSLLCDLTGFRDASFVFEPAPDAPELSTEVRERGTLFAAVQDEGAVTDEMVVDLLLPFLSERLRFIPGANGNGTWKIWRGYVWRDDTAMEHELIIRSRLTALSVALREAAEVAPSAQEGKPLLAAARRYQGDSGIRAVVRLVKAHLACNPASFDTDPMTLNTPAGIVDLKTGETRDGRPQDMMARTTGVSPAPAGTPIGPLFRQFLSDLTGGDGELELYLQKQMGYALTGDVSEKGLWFVWGMADTGKSVWVHTISSIFGDYADSVDAEAFISTRSGRTPDDIARLPGVRLVTATEPSAGQSWNEKTIKAITGGDEISARKLYGSWFTFKPQFKIVIVGNHEPELRQVDDAMLRRIHIVPFDKKVPREKQIPNLSEIMVEEEGDRILRWMLDGCRLWQEEGLEPPRVVQAKTTAYAEEEDTLRQWISDECELGQGYEASRQDLYQAWSGWCRARGEDPGAAKSFRRRIAPVEADLGLSEAQVGDRRLRGYTGIRLAPHVNYGFGETN